jgi:transcriptional regulator with XRE-family HTH domain
MKNFRPAKKRIDVGVGESVRIIRELQELSQSQLAELTGISQATISAIENGRVNLGVERAKVLALALKCHPAVLVFPAGRLHWSALRNLDIWNLRRDLFNGSPRLPVVKALGVFRGN